MASLKYCFHNIPQINSQRQQREEETYLERDKKDVQFINILYIYIL